MKKKILLAVASITCLVSCGGAPQVVKDLTPVDDTKGLEVAKKIVEKQNEMWDLALQERWEAAVALLPHKLTLTDVTKTNGRVKMSDVETVFNDAEVENTKVVLDYDKAYMSYTSTLNYGPTTFKGVYHYFYSENDKTIYALFESGSIKIKFSDLIETDVATIEEARVKMAPYMYFVAPIYMERDDITYSLADYLTATNYYYPGEPGTTFLEYITYEEEVDNVVVNPALTLFKLLKDSLAEFKDPKQYFNWQFGSDDDKSVSLRCDVGFDASDVSLDDIMYKGYGSGMASFLEYEYHLNETFSTYPDLIVFKNNYLSSAEFNDNVDIVSIASKGTPAGALYNKVSTKRNVDFDYENAVFSYPNPDDYILAQ